LGEKGVRLNAESVSGISGIRTKYLISTNGNSHGHPDLEVLARIAVVNKDSGAEIFMNYEVDHIPDWFTNELKESYPNIKLSMDSCEVDL
ncbi:hypothetical protein, partial [Vibrio jasicida]|uniref:hypothetical protein n=1 Tax=Vibrio jasicida TaxID=766224 RepID=UPI001CA5F2FF